MRLWCFLPAQKVPPSEYPYLVLGFGKECPGRIRVISASPAPMRLEVQYGESVEEALSNPYLGANEIVRASPTEQLMAPRAPSLMR